MQHAEQLLPRNELVAVQIVHAERELELLFTRVVARLAALADRTEDGQRLQELQEVYLPEQWLRREARLCLRL